MAYIHEKKKGEKKEYSLRVSIRKEGKIITKDLCYLGSDLSKINIKKLKNDYIKDEEGIRKIKKRMEKLNYFEKAAKKNTKANKFFDEKQMSEINATLNHFVKNFQKIRKSVKKEIWENYKIKFITSNASLEDNLISYEETKKLLKINIPPRNKPLSHAHDLLNEKKILDLLEKETPTINISNLKKIHEMLMENFHRTRGFRTHEIKTKGNFFKIIPAKEIKQKLKKLILWYNKNKTKIHPLALAILFHHKFEKIHPFVYGNGGIGRILMNYQLSQFGYPPLIIPIKLKEEYHKAMNKAYPCLKEDILNIKMKYYKPLMDFMQKQFVKTYWDNLAIFTSQ